MAFRDVLFAPLVSVYVLEGLSDETVAAIPSAFGTVVRTRAAVQRAWPGPAVRQRALTPSSVQQSAEQSVRRAPATLTDAELISAVHRQGFQGLPVALTISGSRCAVAVAHAVMDGAGALQLVHDLLEAASGAELPQERRAVARPVLRAVRGAHRNDLTAFLRARLAKPAATLSATDATAAGAIRHVPPRSTAFLLDGADVAHIRRYREPHRQHRATLHSRLASLIVAALREVASDGPDVPIDVTTDLRHLVDGRVDGNFVTAEQLGTLLGDQWAPGALAARMLEMQNAGRALAFVTSSASWLARGALGRRPRPAQKVTITLARTLRRIDPLVSPTAVTATSLNGSPTFVFVWQHPDAVLLSVWDASGRFSLDRFESAFRGLVSRRAS